MLKGGILTELKPLFRGSLPGQLIVQITDLCNAECPQCGMNKSNRYKRDSLNEDEVFSIIDKAVEMNIKAISFTGGEPFLFEKKLFEYIKYAHKKGIRFTRTGTNGFIFMENNEKSFEERVNKLSENIKDSGLYTFWISIDSWDIEKHEKNRGLKGVIRGIEKAIKIFEKYSLYPSANLGINRLVETDSNYYDNEGRLIPERFYKSYYDGLLKFFGFVSDLGFTIANLCYPMSFEGAVYKAESSDRIVKYTDEEKRVLFKAVLDLLPKCKKMLRVFTPISSIYVLMKQYESKDVKKYACRGGKDYFFVDSSGYTYPCGFLSEEIFGKFVDIKSVRYMKDCTKCDWECFRDPSTLFSPLLRFTQAPLKEIFSIGEDPKFYKFWIKDLIYYRKSNFFNMQAPINKTFYKKN